MQPKKKKWRQIGSYLMTVFEPRVFPEPFNHYQTAAPFLEPAIKKACKKACREMVDKAWYARDLGLHGWSFQEIIYYLDAAYERMIEVEKMMTSPVRFEKCIGGDWSETKGVHADSLSGHTYLRAVVEGCPKFIYRRNFDTMTSFMLAVERAKKEAGIVTILFRMDGETNESFRQRVNEQNRKEEMMAMSRDRVRFYVTQHRLQNHKIRDLLHECLGVSHDDINSARQDAQCGSWNHEDRVEFICRPSQFARFLIARNESGETNDFKGLAPTIFYPEECKKPQPIDASLNSARHC